MKSCIHQWFKIQDIDSRQPDKWEELTSDQADWGCTVMCANCGTQRNLWLKRGLEELTTKQNLEK